MTVNMTVIELQCAGKVLSSVGVSPKTFKQKRCEAQRQGDSEYCPFHQHIIEKCLECGGKLASVDGDIFCQGCLAYIPKITASQIEEES